MGRMTFSETAYRSSVKSLTSKGRPATARGEQKVRETGKLDPLVDPAEFGVIRESRIRLEERKDGLWEVTVGAPVPIEYRLDTTGSMGDNVDRALRVLPNICGLISQALPGRDPFYCASIFGDVTDQFILCRGQFEAEAEKMVNQLTLMHPERDGGDAPEDPHYGLFGAAYLTRAYFQRIGLKSYDFTLTDAPARDDLVPSYVKRVFGKEVWDKVRENGYQLDTRDLPSTREVFRDLSKRAHAFCLQVNDSSDATRFWTGIMGRERVVKLPRIEYAPHVMAAIIGLTEGVLDLRSLKDFLASSNLKNGEASLIVDAVSGIPIGVQRKQKNYGRIPRKGDLFAKKTDLWPVDQADVPSAPPDDASSSDEDGGWL